MKAMSQPVTINENGKRKTISKLAAAVTQLANDAARGDKKSIQLAFALLQAFEPTIEAQRPQVIVVSVRWRGIDRVNPGSNPGPPAT
jgi:Family of unknown function (DUF5681)